MIAEKTDRVALERTINGFKVRVVVEADTDPERARALDAHTAAVAARILAERKGKD